MNLTSLLHDSPRPSVPEPRQVHLRRLLALLGLVILFLTSATLAHAGQSKVIAICEEPTDPPHYIGFWLEKPGTHDSAVFDTWELLLAEHASRTTSLIDIEVYDRENGIQYAAVWHSGGGGEILTAHNNFGGLEAELVEKEMADYGLVEVEVRLEGEDVDYLAVWRQGAPSVELIETTTLSDLEPPNLQADKALIDIEVWKTPSQDQKFLGVLRDRLPGEAAQTIKMSQSWCTFHTNFHDLKTTKRLTDVEFYVNAQGHLRYAAIWSTGSGGDHLKIGYRQGSDLHAEAWVQENSDLLLHDIEVIEAGSGLTMNLQLSLDRRSAREMKPSQKTKATYRRAKRSPEADSGIAYADDFQAPQPPPSIVGAPPLHDTGSSGPD